MKRNNIFKRSLSLLMVMIMVLGMTIIPTFAAGQLAMLTLDSNDFTIVGDIGDTKSITMTDGLDSSYTKVPIDGSKVQWSTSNPAIVQITNTSNTTDTSTVEFELKAEGKVKLTASYTDPGVQSVHSNIVIEGPAEGPVNNIEVTIVDETDNTTLVSKTLGSVSVFSLKDVFGPDFDDADVLKNNPSALHALIDAIDRNPNDIVLKNQGAYIEKLLNREAKFDLATGAYLGWQYEVDRGNQILTPEEAASIFKLESGDKIKFFYGPLSF